MALSSSWGANRNVRDLAAETSTDKLLQLDVSDVKKLLFDALRSSNLHAIRNIFGVNRTLLNAKLFGFEGHDVYETIPNVSYNNSSSSYYYNCMIY